LTNKFYKETPWDSKVFGIYTAELQEYNDFALSSCELNPGLYTLKLNPLSDKGLADKNGFYYCDTLIKPVCKTQELIVYNNSDISINDSTPLDILLKVCNGAFTYGRFHRDFNITKTQADARYNQWLTDIYEDGKVYGLIFKSELAGFIACRGNKLQLHALLKKYRGKGLAKFWWSLVCRRLFEDGFKEVSSSVSATNLAVLNLYSSLGFKFKDATDIYHKLIK